MDLLYFVVMQRMTVDQSVPSIIVRRQPTSLPQPMLTAALFPQHGGAPQNKRVALLSRNAYTSRSSSEVTF